LVGSISGVTAKYKSIDLANFEIYLYDNSGEFNINEDLLLNGNIVCRVSIRDTISTQMNMIVDYSKPDNVLKIDDYGSAYTRFRGGDQKFDAFGYSQFSKLNRIDDYVFTYTGHDADFHTATANGGQVTHVSSESCNLFSVTNLSGSFCSRETIVNYPYVPGYGTFMSLSLNCGDNGKDGLVRRWGLYDDEDGVYFELNGPTFSVNIRSSVTGTVSVRSVTMDDFDVVLPYEIDFSKFQLYWLDFQWQGVGQVRFGLYDPQGTRITLYSFKNPNSLNLPYMKRGTLGFKAEMYNTSNTSSGSEMRLTCLSISREGGDDNLLTSGEEYNYITETPLVANSSNFVPVVTARPKQYYNGVVNRTVVMPLSFEVYSDGAPIRMDVIINGTLNSTSYSVSSNASTSVDLDNTATLVSGGLRSESVIFSDGYSLREFNDSLVNTLTLFPNLYQPTLTFGVKTIVPGSTASVTMIIRWKEVY
jgi:hypothetical protein